MDLLLNKWNYKIKNEIIIKNNEIYDIVMKGKLLKLLNLINENDNKIVEVKDYERRNLLFYSILYNIPNMTLLLLIKKLDVLSKDKDNISIFHIIFDLGNLECWKIIQDYEKFKLYEELYQNLIELKLNYNIKNSDIKKGILVSPDRHLKYIQKNYEKFMEELLENYENYFEKTLNLYNLFYNTNIDNNKKNPLHYGCNTKYKNCSSCISLVLEYKSNFTEIFTESFLQVSKLISKNKLINVSKFENILSVYENFLCNDKIKKIKQNFMKNYKKLIKEIINTQDKQGYSLLHISSFHGDYYLMNKLISLGGNGNLKDLVHNKQPIEYSKNNCIMKVIKTINKAALQNDSNNFKFLLNSGHNIEQTNDIFSQTPLHNTILKILQDKKKDNKELITKDINFMEEVIRCGANINKSDANGWTALHIACYNGLIEAVSKLLEIGADMNIFSNKGYYPIHVACWTNKDKVIKLLIKKGSKINIKDNDGCTPLHLCSKKGSYKSLKELLKSNCNLYTLDKRKWNALHYASYNGNVKCINYLCKIDSDDDKLMKMKNSQNKTPLEIAKSENIKNNFFTIWYSCKYGKLDIVRHLVISGKNINKQTRKTKSTPLIFACKFKHYLIAKFWIEHNADINKIDKSDKSAIDYAKLHKDWNLNYLFPNNEQGYN